MPRFLLLRTAQAALVVWAAFTVTFAILYLVPGDPVSVMLAGASGDGGYVDPAARERLRDELGLDAPAHVQYANALGAALRGDLGRSVTTGTPVRDALADALPHTVALGAAALLTAAVAGTALALVATAVRSPRLREALLALPPLAAAAPTFWIGLVLVQIVSFRWGLLPAIGADGPAALVLPVLTLAVPGTAAVAQVYARALRTAVHEPYTTVAAAKGAGRARVVLRHAGRNAAMPLLTVLGLMSGQVLAGAVVVETVFARPGIGRVTATAVAAQDLPTVLGAVLLAAVLYAVVTLAVDLLHPLVDPRVVLTRRTEVAA